MATAENKTALSSGIHMMLLACTLCLTACASPGPRSSDGSSTASNQATSEVVEEAEIVDDFEGDGMEIPLDGSSLEAFEASVAMVKRHTNEDNYETLQRAINYLLVYDLGAKRDKAKLAARLDGKTGYEVIAKVHWRKPPPGKSSAEKGAADVKIIDT
jgi:hypothetical protein